MNKFKFVLIVLLSIGLIGCAAIFKGKKEEVEFNTSPIGANIYINGILKGTTPKTFNLNSNQDYQIELILEGYRPFKTQLNSEIMISYLVLDILFWFPVSILIDAATVSWYTFDKNYIYWEFRKK